MRLDVLVPHEFAVVQRDVGQNFVDLLLAVVHIHIFAAHFVLLFLVTDDPVASRGHQTYLLSDLGEALGVDDDRALPNSLFALYFRF